MTPSIRPALAAIALAAAAAAHADPAPVAVYTFANTLGSSVAGAPALSAVDPLGASGFVTDTVFGQAQTVYQFVGNASPVLEQAGLTLDVSSLLAGHADNYSVEMVFKFTERPNAWRRILDVQNRQSDNGFYVDPSNNLDIYPVAGGAGFTNGVYHDVFLVNDHGMATFYLDGSQKTTAQTTVMNLDASQTMGFFLDNVVAGGQGEYSSGSVALIRVYDTALTAPPPPVPEPAPFAMLAAGLAVLGWATRRRA